MSDERPPREGREPLTVGDAFGRVRLTTALAVLGAVLAIVGSLGPWVTSPFGSASGVGRGSSDGWLTLGASVVALLVLAAARGRRWGTVAAWLAMLVALAVACLDASKVIYASSKVTLFGHQVASAGWGLYLTAAGALLGAGSLAAAAVFTERDEQGRVTKTRDLRAPALGLVAVVAAGTVTAGILHEHSQLKGSGTQANAPSARTSTHPAAATTPTAATQTTTATTPPTTTTTTTSTQAATSATTTTAAGASPGTCPPHTHAVAGQCADDTTQPVYGTTDQGGGHAQWFTSPTGNIGCELDVGRGGGPDRASCQTAAPPQTASLTADGHVTSCAGNSCELGNGPEGEHALQYGNKTELGPFTCSSDALTGITCTASGGGFSINRSGVKHIG